MILILDCDIASTLAKIGRLDLLKRVFSDSEIYITNSVYIELMSAKEAGFSFPEVIFNNIPVISMDNDDLKVFQDLSQNKFIHYGEAEGLCICKNKGAIFMTNDSKVVRFCEDAGIDVLDLKDFLILVGLRKAVSSSEMNELLQEIEEKDNTYIKDKAVVLEEFEVE